MPKTDNQENTGEINNSSFEKEPEHPSFQEVLEHIPVEQREFIEQSLSIATCFQNSPESAVSKKINEEHISTFLKDSGDNMRLTHKGQTQNRILTFAIAFLLVFFFCFIIWVFKNYPDVVEKLIFTAGGVIVGGLGGFGFGKFQHRE